MAGINLTREEKCNWLSRATGQPRQKLSGFSSQKEELEWLNRAGPVPKKKIQSEAIPIEEESRPKR
jgi:hypothetical protein